MIQKLFLRFSTVLFTFLLFTQSIFAGGGKPATELNNVIDVSKLSGINKFIAELYNQDPRILFALLVTTFMSLTGLFIAYLTDFFLKKGSNSQQSASH